jgi:hypothetical protein
MPREILLDKLSVFQYFINCGLSLKNSPAARAQSLDGKSYSSGIGAIDFGAFNLNYS